MLLTASFVDRVSSHKCFMLYKSFICCLIAILYCLIETAGMPTSFDYNMPSLMCFTAKRGKKCQTFDGTICTLSCEKQSFVVIFSCLSQSVSNNFQNSVTDRLSGQIATKLSLNFNSQTHNLLIVAPLSHRLM